MHEDSWSPIRILFVDDNPDDRLLAQRQIRREFPALEAVDIPDVASFRSALDTDFDMVITDYQLRWSDGLSVLRSVKERWPQRPVLMFTGSGSEEIAVEAMRFGLDDYVLKGARRGARLTTAVRAAVERGWERRNLAESEARYRLLFDSVPVGLFRSTPDGRILDANPALARILGFRDESEVADHSWRELWLDEKEWERWLATIRRDGVARGFEARIRRVDGTARWVVQEARAVAAGPAARWLEGSVVDITERRLAEEALRASEARKGAMLEAATDAVIAIDESGRISEFSPSAERTFGHQRDDVVGREMAAALLPPDLREEYRSGLARYLRTGESPMVGSRIDFRALHADGREFPVELTLSHIDLPGPPAFIAYVRDVSEQRRQEEGARQAQQIEAASRLAGTIAQEFGNTLTVIDGFVSLLLNDVGGDRREMLEEIRNAASSAATLTRRLIAFSHRQVLRPEPVDLNELVLDAQPRVENALPGSIITTVATAPGPILVEVEPDPFVHVLLSIADNACAAMPSGGTLMMTTATEELDTARAANYPGLLPGRHAVVAVTTAGLLIEEATDERIFDAYFTAKLIDHGIGPGLALAYGTVRQMGGSISVDSEPGRGTTFRIHFPVSPADANAFSDADEPSRRLRPGTSVLVVEDDRLLREILVLELERAGAAATGAANGSEVLVVSQPGFAPDLVVIDAVMPLRSGPEVVRGLRQSRPGQRVLYIVGPTARLSDGGMEISPLTHVLRKPFYRRDFIDAVARAIEPTAAVAADSSGRPGAGVSASAD